MASPAMRKLVCEGSMKDLELLKRRFQFGAIGIELAGPLSKISQSQRSFRIGLNAPYGFSDAGGVAGRKRPDRFELFSRVVEPAAREVKDDEIDLRLG